LSVEAGRQVVEARDEVVPHLLVEGGARVELADVLAHAGPEGVGAERIHRRAEQREAIGQQTVAGEVVERGHQ
jgi:hypothetical protein